MDIEETKKLLLFIQAGDNRTLSEVDLALWVDELPPQLDLQTATAAVKAFRARPEAEIARHPWLDIPAFRVYVKRVREAAAADARKAEAVAATAGAIGPGRRAPRRTLRDRDPAEWDRLVEEGRIQGNADRAYHTNLRQTGNTHLASEAYKAEQRATAERIAYEKQRDAGPTAAASTPDPASLAGILNRKGNQ